MILKRPYAFFIRFFKVFHLFVFAMASMLLYRTSLVYNFMKEFCKSSPNVVGKDLVGPLFNGWMYPLIILIILINLLIIYILARKVKPYLYYVINIFLYIGVFIVLANAHSVISDMQVMLVTAKKTLAIRDILNLTRLVETVSVVFYLIRATGFDIKKFDFARDLQGLDISAEDSEEIEVAVEFERNVFIRDLKRNFREFKYYYVENKFIINIICALFIGVVLLFIYLGIDKYDKVYKENQFFRVSRYRIGVKSSYIFNTDYMGHKIIDDDVLVGVKVSVSGSGTLSSSRNVLVVNGMQYYPFAGYISKVADLGEVYNLQELSGDFADYLLIYKVPKDVIGSSMILRCIDGVSVKRGRTVVNSLDVKLSPVNLIDAKTTSFDYSIGSDIDIGDYKINISEFEIKKQIVLKYNSCVRTDECYEFKEILSPVVSRNSEKVLLRLNGNILLNDKSINFSDFFMRFASIEYVYNGNSYEEYWDFNSVYTRKVTDKSSYYFEVNSDIANASIVKLNFNFRDKKYSYILRGDEGA